MEDGSMDYLPLLIEETKYYLYAQRRGEVRLNPASPLLNVDRLHQVINDYKGRDVDFSERKILKAVGYFMLELILENQPQVQHLKSELDQKLSTPLFRDRCGARLSVTELEQTLQAHAAEISTDEKNRAQQYISEEVAPLVDKRWRETDRMCQSFMGASYVDCYDDFFDGTMTLKYRDKKEMCATVADLFKEQRGAKADDPQVILADVRKVAAKLTVKFDLNTIKLENVSSPRASMYADPFSGEVTLRWPSGGGVTPVATVWHECGHAIHYQNMRSDLPFAFKHLFDLRVLEAIAILWEIIGCRYYGIPFLGQEKWWPTIQFLSTYEWLKSQGHASYQKLFDDNLRLIFGHSFPKFPGAIRFLEPAFKCFRYVSAFDLAQIIDRRLVARYTDDWIFSSEAGKVLRTLMREGGAIDPMLPEIPA